MKRKEMTRRDGSSHVVFFVSLILSKGLHLDGETKKIFYLRHSEIAQK